MKVVHIIASCSSGGAEIFAKSLIISLKQEGIEEIQAIQLWVMSRAVDIDPNNNQKINFEKLFVNEIEKNNIIVKFMGKRPKQDWHKSVKSLQDAYISFKPDIIHTHLESVTFHVCRAFSKFKVPIVQTIHSTNIKYPFIQKYYINKRIESYIAISHKVRSNIKNILKIEDDKIFLIHNGIKTEEFQVLNRNIKQQVTRIIAIGRLTKAKDHETLLNALEILKNKLNFHNVKMPEVIIVGDGELKENIIDLTHLLNLSNYIKFLGIRDDIPKLLIESDIYVMSSQWEGLSISLIEALVSTIPIVATDAGSNDEIINNGINGLIVPVKDSEALAEGLYSLIVNYDLRKKLSLNAKNNINKFEVKSCALKHIKMYNEVLIFNQ